MGLTRYQSFIKARINRPITLGRTHIDPALITLTFVYQELVKQDEAWIVKEKREILKRDAHYKLDRRRGVIMLIDHPFWQQEGRWRVADRVEPLLYKGQVKHPQRIEFDYEHYVSKEVKASEFTDEIDAEAKERLGYDVKKYALAEPPMKPAPFDWGEGIEKAKKEEAQK